MVDILDSIWRRNSNWEMFDDNLWHYCYIKPVFWGYDLRVHIITCYGTYITNKCKDFNK